MPGDATGQHPGRGRRGLLAWGILGALSAWSPVSAANQPAGRTVSAATGPLRRRLRGAVVDWQEGIVLARASQPADFSLPGGEATRLAAIRRARERGLEVLAQALPALPLSRRRKPSRAAIQQALARAQERSVELDSAGGARVEVAVAFADLSPEPSGAAEGAGATDLERVILAVGAMPLEAAPPVVIGKATVAVRSAVYRLDPPPKGALRARRDARGRLVVAPVAGDRAAIAQAGVVIHLRKPPGR